MAIGLLEQRQGKKKMEKKRHALGDRKEDAETVSHKEAQQKRKNKNKK